MTREETKVILSVLKAGYPNFYKDMSREDAKNIVDLWATMFANDPVQIVTEAVKALMCTLKYPPTIADVKEKINLLTQPKQMTEQEAWNLVKKAMNTSDFIKSFQELPPIIQKLVGSASALKEMAYSEGDITVISSNFMRSYRVMAAREQEYNRLPESSKKLINQLSGSVGLLEGDSDG
jgi:hypothetical protein